MSTSRAIFVLFLGGVLVMVGCKKDEKLPEPPPPGAAPAVPTPSTAGPASPGVKLPAIPSLPDAPNPTTLPALSPGSGTLTTTTPGIGASAGDAKTVLADATKNVEAKNWDAAGDDFKKLNAMKSRLSPEMKDAISSAEAKFVAAKAGSSLTLPGFGGGPASTAPAPEPNK